MNTIDDVVTAIRGVLDGILNTSDSGLMGRAREMTAFTQYIGKAGTMFAGNDIIEQLLPNLLSGDFFQSPAPFKNPSDIFGAMENLGQALPMNEAGVQVRQFIVGLVESVAGASGGGLFGRGAKLSDDEAGYLDILKSKLGL